jgi:hypothetical protein
MISFVLAAFRNLTLRVAVRFVDKERSPDLVGGGQDISIASRSKVVRTRRLAWRLSASESLCKDSQL